MYVIAKPIRMPITSHSLCYMLAMAFLPPQGLCPDGEILRRLPSNLGVYVVVQFYPWFKFSFLLFQTHYHVIIIHFHTQKQKKRKFEPRIKLNHNIYKEKYLQLKYAVSIPEKILVCFYRDQVESLGNDDISMLNTHR